MRLPFLCLPPSQLSPGRTTADGYNIYKEDELALSTTGGGDHPIPESLLPILIPSSRHPSVPIRLPMLSVIDVRLLLFPHYFYSTGF